MSCNPYRRPTTRRISYRPNCQVYIATYIRRWCGIIVYYWYEKGKGERKKKKELDAGLGVCITLSRLTIVDMNSKPTPTREMRGLVSVWYSSQRLAGSCATDINPNIRTAIYSALTTWHVSYYAIVIIISLLFGKVSTRESLRSQEGPHSKVWRRTPQDG